MTHLLITAMVAGMAPSALIISSRDLATSKFVGFGRPWVMIVDSKATTGWPCLIACCTSGWIFIFGSFDSDFVEKNRILGTFRNILGSSQ